MPSNYHHGIRVTEVNDGVRPIRTVSTAIIGLVATASDADAAAFPLNKPTLVTNVYSALAKAGVLGTLAASLDAISQQCTPLVVVVRVEEGATQEETNSNVIGTVQPDGQFTGMKALLAAQAQLGVKPRILGAPGLDTQPVATALVALAQQLRGFTYVNAHGALTVAEATAYRQNFGARELMVIHPDWTVWDTTTNALRTAPAVAFALGLRAKIDTDIGWHKTLSNVAVNGVNGLSRDIYWDLQNPASDAGVLNASEVTTLINHNGFRFWGSRTCSEDPLFAFESATRTAQVLADTMIDANFWAVDKNLGPAAVKDILEAINTKMRSLRTDGYLMGGSAWYSEEVNTTATLKSGKLSIDYDYQPVPPIEDLSFVQRITDRYTFDFAARIAA